MTRAGRIAGLVGSTAAALASAAALGLAQGRPPVADLIVVNARIATMDAANPAATALAVKDGVFVAVGDERDVAAHRGPTTRVIDARGRTLVPGLDDSHAHVVRGGRFYNLELRWDGVDSLARGLAMIREQARRTPAGQWVRVIGGWSPYQFVERRMPTVAELNEAAPDTPTFVLFLYSQGLLNRSAVEALGLTADTPAPEGGRFELVDGGAILHAEPSPAILYQLIARLPQLSPEDQVNSTRHFYRELNRLGMTSAVDCGGGGHAYPDDYAGSQRVAREGELSLRVSYYLFPQEAGRELQDFRRWARSSSPGQSAARDLEHGFELEGAGEFLAHAVGDWENFLADAPDVAGRAPRGQDPRDELKAVTTLLVQQGWPLRQHATYGDSVALILDVFEEVKREQGRFAPRWALDHAETARDEDLRRIQALGGGVSVQNRLAFGGEYFVERYGAEAAREAPPIQKMLALGIPVALGTDGTRVSSYDPWLAVHWLVTGETLGGTKLFADGGELSREDALRLITANSAWFSQEERVKGRIARGQYADFAVLGADYFTIPAEEIKDLASVLTVVGGRVVWAAAPFADLAPPPLPPVSPAWSPVARFGGYQHRRSESK